MANKKYSILSFNFNNYEILRDPAVIEDEIEYVLVTDDKTVTSDKWTIKYIPEYLNDASGFTKSFYVRYHPFEFVSTDVCLVIDGSIQIKDKLSDFIKDFVNSNCDICLSSAVMLSNPLYKEYDWFVRMKGYDYTQSLKNIAMIKALGYNEAYKGYFEANIKIVKKTDITDTLHNFVWNCILKISPNNKTIDRLDQTILSGVVNFHFPELKIFHICRQAIQSKRLCWMEHHTNKPIVVPINYDNIWFQNQKIKPYLL